ncbi:CBS domain-containing protein [Salinirubrum litoreum]|uniref:CBS domain-containing protein n=1 Tax=Salinirubrum litoreum TaxID=1126234 RepID=A0ABD5RCU3_9EURY|nr:CBS domain-containing protein [Salinirubrum litoreum]
MPIIDITRTTVVTAGPDTPVGDVTRAMRERDLEYVVVLAENQPVGLLSPADIGRAYVAGTDLGSVTAGELLSGEPVTVQASADLSTFVGLLGDTGAQRAIVVDDDGFVGVVTLDDALAQYGRDLTRVLDLLD